MKTLRLFLFFLSAIVGLQTYGQFAKGFDKKEALDMIAICNSFTFLKVYNNDRALTPQGYTKVYQSGTIGLGNQWQMWKHKNYAVINLRGSTTEPISWMGNLYAAMIPAKGKIVLPDSETFNYQVAPAPKANVHSGWMLSVAFLSKDILRQIKLMNYEGVYHFIITGHSQGGAIAQLLRAYLENLSPKQINAKNKFKTYAFASPRVGNIAFSESYNEWFYTSSFTINNSKDPVTQMPYTFGDNQKFDLESIGLNALNKNTDYFKSLVYKALGEMAFNNPDSAYIEKAGYQIERQITKEIGYFRMPAYQLDMSYRMSGQHIDIEPFNYKEIANKTYTKKLGITENSNYFQHKPYLYYLYITKKYFPNRF